MIKIYTAENPPQAHLLKNKLQAEGIAAMIKGEQTFALRGEAAAVPGDAYPTVWVSPQDAPKAKQVVHAFDSGTGGEPWTCGTCGTELEAQFKACWRCGGQ